MKKERKQQAQYLLGRYVEGNISEKEQTILFHFLNEETESEEWLEMIEELLAAEPELATYNKDEWQPVIESTLRRQQVVVSIAKVRSMRIWRWIAAASIIVLFIAGYWFYQHNSKQQPATPAVAKTKDIEAPKTTRATITLVDGRQVSIDSISNGTLATQANITIQKTANGQIVYQPTNGIATEMLYNTLTNPRGSKVIDMQLIDGSHVWLNAGSSVKFPVAFIGNERKVFITGEAYFEVAHDASHPFIVSKGDVSVTVLGTHFNVNAYDDEDVLKVTLLQGSVKVANNSGAVLIKPGQQAQLTTSYKPQTANNVDLDEVMAWKNGKFSFNRADIKSVMRELARWYDLDVEYQGQPTTDLFGGDIQRDLPLSKTLDFLKKSQVNFEVHDRKIIVKR